MDESAKKEALRLFTYGLYAVTVGDQSEWNTFTANWVTQVSFDPPLVALSIENDSHSLPILQRTRRFAVNVYSADQRELAGTLGKPFARKPEKLEGLRVAYTSDGCPTLPDTLAWVECAVENELPAGDSTLVLGRVVDAGVVRRDEPLTMLAAGFKHAG
jgi:flavin reductase (DIM6/NTAB) family NADH-FMN oxidoreductase RutF